MSSLSEIPSILAKLIPFLASVIVYFAVPVPNHERIVAAFTKCLPIVCLIIFVGLHSFGMDEKNKWYAKVIIVGLIFCGLGDAFLVWPNLFELGILAFAIGHVCYMFGFGFQPRAWILGIALALFATGVLIYFGPSLEGVEIAGVPIYTYLILSMVWRGWARLTQRQNWSWILLITAIGTLIFATSDFLLALDRYKVDLAYANELIMTTYYIAQLLIALSVVEPRCPTVQVTVFRWKIWCF